MSCNFKCEQGRNCVCEQLQFIPREVNQDLADYADQYEASVASDILNEVVLHFAVTIIVMLGVIGVVVLVKLLW